MKLRYKAAMEMAEKVASLSEHRCHKVGCVLTDRRHNLVSVGVNSYKTHPLQAKYAEKAGMTGKIHVHAEIDALARSRGDVYNCYVVRVRKGGGRGLAKPCKSCEKALIAFGVGDVYWSE